MRHQPARVPLLLECGLEDVEGLVEIANGGMQLGERLGAKRSSLAKIHTIG